MNQVVVITRFNIGIYSHGLEYFTRKGKLDRPTDPDEWMEKRLYWLSKVYLPALQAQIYDGFKLYFIVDENTPQAFVMVYTRLIAEAGLLERTVFIPTKEPFCDNWSKDQYGVKRHIENTLDEDVQYLTTVTLDSDSAMNTEAFAWLRTRRPFTTTMYEVLHGYHIATDQADKFVAYRGVSPEFITSHHAICCKVSEGLEICLEHNHWEYVHRNMKYVPHLRGVQIHHSTNIAMIGNYAQSDKLNNSIVKVNRLKAIFADMGIDIKQEDLVL